MNIQSLIYRTLDIRHHYPMDWRQWIPNTYHSSSWKVYFIAIETAVSLFPYVWLFFSGRFDKITLISSPTLFIISWIVKLLLHVVFTGFVWNRYHNWQFTRYRYYNSHGKYRRCLHISTLCVVVWLLLLWMRYLGHMW